MSSWCHWKCYNNPIDTFGEWVRYQRNQLRLTREQLADRVGCSVSMLRKIEDGERHPSDQIAGLLANCLDIPPGERSTFVKVAHGEFSVERLPSESKPAAGEKPPRTNLPVYPTLFLGRQGEVEELSKLLLDPGCRLVTLVGPGGIGKTRLAVETASQAQDAFADGVYFVPLAPVNRTSFLAPMIADAIGFRFQSQSRLDPKTQLFSYLHEKRVLLLLDNLEQFLSEPGVEVLAELLESARHVKLLATSRQPLELQSEWIFEVQGLPLPESVVSEGWEQNTSIELFLQRARRAQVGFDPAAEDYPAILRVCQLVEGNPLGIELAAAWVRNLTCSEIAQEIQRGLDFLSTSMRDLPARHRSMRAVFDHSWKLLPQAEQGYLSRLSVFRGGFQRQAAEQVAGATLPALSTLLTKSLIQRGGEGRYDLHGLIRQFASEHLAASPEEQAKVQASHARYYLAFFARLEAPLGSSAQRQALAELTAEIDNFKSAWDWAMAHGELTLIGQTLRTFAMLYDLRAWLQEGLDMLGLAVMALDKANAGSPLDRSGLVTLGRMLAARALLASRLGEYEGAQRMLQRSIDILRPLNEPRVLVETITFLAMVTESTGDYARASELYSEGLEIARETGDRWFAALCFTGLTALGGFMHRTAEPEVTYERFQSAVAEWRQLGDPRMTAIALNNLSLSAQILGRYDEARIALEESLALSGSVGDRWGSGFAYRGLGLIAQAKGQHLEAVEKFHQSLEILTDLGARQDGARILAEMGNSHFALGHDAEARGAWLDALHIGIETKGTFIALEALTGIASLQAKQGNVAYAFELLSFVEDHSASIQETKDRAARLRLEWEAKLTRGQVEAARERLKGRTIESIVEEVLEA